MAIGDIFSAELHYECPTSAASNLMYYRESAAVADGPGPVQLADALISNLTVPLRSVISSEYWFPSITVRKVFGSPEPKWRADNSPQIGLQAGPSLPANNCILISLLQSAFGARSNGKIYVPGIPEVQTLVGQLLGTFMTAAVAGLLDALTLPIEEAGAAGGEWQVGVISRKVLDAAPPAKDWANAFALVTSFSASPIIATQRRRESRAIGRTV